MSTDKDALREKARAWLKERGLDPLGPAMETQHELDIDSLAALLAAERADAVAQEREACAHVADNARIIEFEKRMSHSDTVMLAYNIAKAIRARTTTPTPSEREPSEGSSPEQAGRASGSPSGEQPGVGELVEALDKCRTFARIVAAGNGAAINWEDHADGLDNLLARARQPRADYDAKEIGEKT